MGVHRADATVGAGRIAAEMTLRAAEQPLKRQLEVKGQRHYQFFTSPEVPLAILISTPHSVIHFSFSTQVPGQSVLPLPATDMRPLRGICRYP